MTKTASQQAREEPLVGKVSAVKKYSYMHKSKRTYFGSGPNVDQSRLPLFSLNFEFPTIFYQIEGAITFRNRCANDEIDFVFMQQC